MNKVKHGNTPIFLFRFEDLLSNTEEVLTDMFQFILGLEDGLQGTIIEKRIKDVIHNGKKNFLYKPRTDKSSSKGNKHANTISEEQMQKLRKELEYYMHFWGYAVDERPTADQNGGSVNGHADKTKQKYGGFNTYES